MKTLKETLVNGILTEMSVLSLVLQERHVLVLEADKIIKVIEHIKLIMDTMKRSRKY